MTTAPVLLFSVMLKDEAPAIGCGYRFVFVKRGRKWVYLLSPFIMRACKVRREGWDGLGAGKVTDPDTIKRTRQALRRNHREPTRLERQAMGGKT